MEEVETQYTVEQVKELLAQQEVPGDDARILIAIAYLESKFKHGINGDTDIDDKGLWPPVLRECSALGVVQEQEQAAEGSPVALYGRTRSRPRPQLVDFSAKLALGGQNQRRLTAEGGRE